MKTTALKALCLAILTVTTSSATNPLTTGAAIYRKGHQASQQAASFVQRHKKKIIIGTVVAGIGLLWWLNSGKKDEGPAPKDNRRLKDSNKPTTKGLIEWLLIRTKKDTDSFKEFGVTDLKLSRGPGSTNCEVVVDAINYKVEASGENSRGEFISNGNPLFGFSKTGNNVLIKKSSLESSSSSQSEGNDIQISNNVCRALFKLITSKSTLQSLPCCNSEEVSKL